MLHNLALIHLSHRISHFHFNPALCSSQASLLIPLKQQTTLVTVIHKYSHRKSGIENQIHGLCSQGAYDLISYSGLVYVIVYA